VLEVKSDVFRVELVEEDDGRWRAGVPVLPGCTNWGHTREEALHNIRDAAEAYISGMQNAGEESPKDATTRAADEPAVAVIV
jgi:predicted RNase H-like HicB family nuclease